MDEMNYMEIEQWMEHMTAAQRENNLPEFDKAVKRLKDLIKIDKCRMGIETYIQEKDKFIKKQDDDAVELFRTACNGNSFEDILNHFEAIVTQHNSAINDNLLKYMNVVAKHINKEGYLILLKNIKKEQHGE